MNKYKIKIILDKLDKKYGKKYVCFLNYKKDYELLFATILSAQCTDARVNEVTKILFNKYKKLDDYANANIKDIEKIIISCGFYHNKAVGIIESAKLLKEKYNGKVPSDIKDLIKLKGVGRKTANVIRTYVYNIPSIVCDTHVIRTSNLLGLGNVKDPKELEMELMKTIPKEHWSRLNPQLITLGREICKAKDKDCKNCFLSQECDFYNKISKKKK